MTVIHTKPQAASIIQILTSDVRHVVEAVWFRQGVRQYPNLFPLGPEEEEPYLVAMPP